MVNKELIKAYALKNALEHNGKSVEGAVINALFNHGLKKDKVKTIIKDVQLIVKEINGFSKEEQKYLFEEHKKLITKRKQRHGLPELKNVKIGKFATRFSPSASGPLHIGHIITGLYNSLYAKKYKGKFYFRIEDTNPDNIYKPAYKMLKEDAKWIFDNIQEIIIQSNRLQIYYKYIEKLINKNKAYVCDCNPDEFKKLLLKSKACKCRRLSVNENIKRWKKMLDKREYKQGQAVLRFKSDLKLKNPAFRDFPLARINETSHPIQKNKFRVWPLMNLSVAVDDIEYKITHSIRGKDHKDNAQRQKMIYTVLGLLKQYPEVYFIGRLHFKDLELSTTKIRQEIEKGEYTGWDDERLPFIAGLKKKYKKQAFIKMVEERGLSEVDKIISKKDFFELLDNFNF